MISLKTKFKSLFSPICRSFTVYSNQLFSPSETIGNEIIYYDHNTEDYEPIIQAYLTKRRIGKSEIGFFFIYFINPYCNLFFSLAPKIYAIQGLKSLTSLLKSQKIMPVKNFSVISAEAKQKFKNPDDINSQYIVNMVCEEYFKEMIDEYLSKIIISGL